MKREPTEQEILLGRSRLEIILKDGKPELLEIELLSIRKLQDYMKAKERGDQAACAELLTGKPTGWADSLPVPEVYRICEVGEALNVGPFAEFVRFGSGQTQFLKRILEKAGQLASPVSSPPSASPPA